MLPVVRAESQAGDRWAKVDPDDVPHLSRFRWFLTPSGYARRENAPPGESVLMHRLIMRAPAERQVDHIDHDRLNNRRGNLRLLTPGENARHRKGANRNSRTGARGVSVNRQGMYVVQAMHDGKRHHGGVFTTLAEAEAAAVNLRRSLGVDTLA